MIILGCAVGFLAWFALVCVLGGFYTVDQNERAVKTSFGRAERVGNATTLDDPIAEVAQARKSESATAIRRCASSRRAGLFQVAVGAGPQGLDRHADDEHGLRSRDARRQPPAARCSRRSPRISSTPASRARSATASPRTNLYAYLFGVKRPDRARHGLLRLGPARAHRQLRGARRRRPSAPTAKSEPRPRDRHLDQRPAQEPARPQRAHGPRVQLVGGALRHRARRLADHRHRSAAGGRVGARGDQHRAQPGLVRHQPGAGRAPTRRSCSRGARWRSRRSRPRPRSSR